MSTETTVSKWGDGLAVCIPPELVHAAHIAEGDQLTADLQSDGSIVLRSVTPRFTLEDLVSGITPENLHPAVDWGPPVGKEYW